METSSHADIGYRHTSCRARREDHAGKTKSPVAIGYRHLICREGDKKHAREPVQGMIYYQPQPIAGLGVRGVPGELVVESEGRAGHGCEEESSGDDVDEGLHNGVGSEGLLKSNGGTIAI